MKVKSLIIDDNPFIIDLLSDLLREQHPGVMALGSAKSGKEGIEKIKAVQPDLVFLDVEMPDMSGFDMLGKLPEITFQTIFITSYSHYAIRAIRFNALDYLVKPIAESELRQAIKRYYNSRKAGTNLGRVQDAMANLQTEKVEDKKLFLNTQEGELRIVLKTIVRIEGERNYSNIYLENNTRILSSKSLVHFEELLSDKGFFRCHRSHLINGFHVTRLNKQNSFVLNDRSEIPVSRRKRGEAKSWMNQLLAP